MNHITLTGHPLSTGSIYRSHCKFGYPNIYMTTEGKNLKRSYQLEAKSQWKEKPIQGPVELEIYVYHGKKRKCDIDNFNKILFDSLTGIVWDDDHQIEELRIVKGYDKERPRFELYFKEIT